jgi:hypothetical protein
MCLLLIASLFAVAIAKSALAVEPEVDVLDLRSDILQSISLDDLHDDSVADAYTKLFARLGPVGTKKFINDDDTSIALQAAWETYKRRVKKQTAFRGRTQWGYDKDSLEEFLTFLAERLQSEPPDWWRATLLEVDVFPGRHHAFIDFKGKLPKPPKVRLNKGEVTIASAMQSVTIRKSMYDKFAPLGDPNRPPVVHWDQSTFFFARPEDRSYPYDLVCVDLETGKELWLASIWASRRGVSTGAPGRHPVEIRQLEGTVIVYGGGQAGMYIEGFDAKTGECRFRFCTSYWMHFSEAWRVW